MSWSLFNPFQLEMFVEFFTSVDDSDPTPSESPHRRDPFPSCVLIQWPAWPWPYWKATHLQEVPQIFLWCGSGTNALGHHQHSLPWSRTQETAALHHPGIDCVRCALQSTLQLYPQGRISKKLNEMLSNIVEYCCHFQSFYPNSVINNAAKSLRKAILPENVTSADSVPFRDEVNISEVCQTACRISFLALT